LKKSSLKFKTKICDDPYKNSFHHPNPVIPRSEAIEEPCVSKFPNSFWVVQRLSAAPPNLLKDGFSRSG